jgi:hypothetical protein
MTKIIGCLQKVEPWDVNSKLEEILSFQLRIIPHALVWLFHKFLQVIVFCWEWGENILCVFQFV